MFGPSHFLCSRLSLGAIFVCILFVAGISFSQDTRNEFESEFQRVFGFCDHMFDRELEFRGFTAACEGRTAFDRREIPTCDGSEFYRTAGAVSSSRNIICIKKYSQGQKVRGNDLKLIQLKVILGREAKTIVGLTGKRRGIKFIEGPSNSSLEKRLQFLGNSIWFGSLHLEDLESKNYLPEIRQWTNLSQVQSSDSGLTGNYCGWQFEIRYVPNMRGIPLTIMATNTQRPVRPESYVKFDFTVIQEWIEHEGVKIPKKVENWALISQPQGTYFTSYDMVELQSLGPKQTISDRYGDYFTDIPNGTPVQVNDYMGIEFIWQDGEIVRKIDHAKLATMVGKRFFPSPFRRFVLMGFGGVALLALGWVIWHWSRGGGGFKARGFEKK